MSLDEPQPVDADSPLPDGEPERPPGAGERVRLTFDLPSGEHIRITIETVDGAGEMDATPVGVVTIDPMGEVTGSPEIGQVTVERETPVLSVQAAAPTVTAQPRWRAAWRRAAIWLPAALFGLAVLVYFSVRVIGLTRFPIYFFTDEAVQTMLAADLVRDNFHSGDGDVLPTFFKNGNYYNLGTSVYLQLLPYLLFGKSAFLTRLVSVLVSLLAALSVGLMLRDYFRISYWWCGTLLLSIAPAWFLHSRTAFETAVFVSLYAGMLYAYLGYRLRSPRWLYPTLILATLAFYAYSPGQVVVAATGLLLLVLDAPHHWRNRRYVLRGLLLGLLLTVPYLRFRVEHPEAALDHLRLLNSYWLQPLPLGEKLSRFTSEYLYGLSPSYWFIPNQRDLPRHLMKGYGHLLRLTLPFAVTGLILTLRGLRQPQYRLLLVSLLVGPLGSALVGIGITRVLVMVIPASLLTALGIAWVMDWLERPADRLREWRVESVPAWLERWKLPQPVLSLGLFAILLGANIGMLTDALRNGPTWYRDYGLGGMQYGAVQAFGEVQRLLEQQPEMRIIFSPTWANGTDVLARFFLGDPLPVEIGSIQGHMDRRMSLDEHTLFITTPDEYAQIAESGKFTDIRLERTLPYPDGTPGFHFVRLRYVDDIDQIFAAEQAQRRQLQEETVQIGGQDVRVRYPVLDIGSINLLFDGDPYSMLRTLEANPLVIELDFPAPREINGFSILIGSANTQISALATSTQGTPPAEFTKLFRGSVDEPGTRLDFGAAFQVQSLRIEVLDMNQDEPAHVHVWEITLHAP